ncbi:Lrp/AsnC ligand binding domain-containing protein [bacterium]|nr:Lrp/AsnC ligand binding domain-containing protein [bacterium]
MAQINKYRCRVNQVAERLAEIDGISEVYSVSGRYDLIAILCVKSNDDLAELVTNRMMQIDGIASTETLQAFRAISKYDLEAMFAIGQ